MDIKEQARLAARRLGLDPSTIAFSKTDKGLLIHHGHQTYLVQLDPEPAGLAPHQKEMINKPAMYSREELQVIAGVLGIQPAGRGYKKDLVKAINNWKEENDWTP